MQLTFEPFVLAVGAVCLSFFIHVEDEILEHPSVLIGLAEDSGRQQDETDEAESLDRDQAPPVRATAHRVVHEAVDRRSWEEPQQVVHHIGNGVG